MAGNQRILIVDKDRDSVGAMVEALQQEDYSVREVSDLSDSFDPVGIFRPDLVILDPAVQGNDPQQRIQKFWNTYRIPVLIVSDKGDVISKVISLEMGADDYLVKPFDIREFVARVHALLRRSDITLHSRKSGLYSLEFDGLRISLSNYTVSLHGNKIPMPPKEIELLYFLASSPNQVFTREQLLSHIWGYDYAGDSRTVDVHIKRIRKKLPPSENWSIATVWGVGYKFQASI